MKKFKIDNMKDLYEDKILKRGFEYYLDNRVKSASCYSDNTHLIKFKVQGIEIYTVYILLDKKDKNVLKMKCNCPYHNNCKHTAAAVYYLKDGKDIDIKVRKNIKNEFQNELDVGLVFVIDKQTITSIDGFFDLLNEKTYQIEEQLYNRKTKLATENLFYLINKIDLVNRSTPSFCFNYDNDVVITNNYDLESIEEKIQKVIYEIFLTDESLLEKNLIKYLKKKSLWKHDISFFLDGIYSKCNNDDLYILLDLIQKLNNIHLRIFSKEYLKFLEAQIYLIKLDNKEYLKEAKKIEKNNKFVRQLLVDYYISNNNTKDAIILLNKERNILNYSKLLEIYQDDVNNYNDTLINMFKYYPSIETYEEVMNRNIKVNKKQLLKELLHNNLNYEEIKFFIKNGFEDYMFDYLKNNPDYDMFRFDDLLKEKYNDELIELLKEKISDLLIDQKNNNDEIVKLLFKLNKLNNGNKECNNIIKNIKKTKKNDIDLLRSLLYFEMTI